MTEAYPKTPKVIVVNSDEWAVHWLVRLQIFIKQAVLMNRLLIISGA